jgi:hypothetical protein
MYRTGIEIIENTDAQTPSDAHPPSYTLPIMPKSLLLKTPSHCTSVLTQEMRTQLIPSIPPECNKPCLPETAPANIMLAQVLEVRRFLDQPIDLHLVVQLLTRPKVFTGQLLLDTRQDL